MKKLISIPVVDDNDEIRQLFSTCRREAGYQVFEAANGKDGWQLAQTRAQTKRRPRIDRDEVCPYFFTARLWHFVSVDERTAISQNKIMQRITIG